jgi:hypothetical protein
MTDITGSITDPIIQKFLDDIHDDIEPVVKDELSDLTIGELLKCEQSLSKLDTDKYNELITSLNKIKANEKKFEVQQHVKRLVSAHDEKFKDMPKSILKKDHYRSENFNTKHVRFAHIKHATNCSTVNSIVIILFICLIFFLISIRKSCDIANLNKWNFLTSKKTNIDNIMDLKK